VMSTSISCEPIMDMCVWTVLQEVLIILGSTHVHWLLFKKKKSLVTSSSSLQVTRTALNYAKSSAIPPA
jgi:hypothetical protein